MGIIYEMKHGFVEAREKSVTIYIDESTIIEVDYKDLDSLEILVKKAQQVRRDKPAL